MKKKQIWIIDEGSQGHVVQSRGLLREMAKLMPVEAQELRAKISVKPKLARSLVKRVLRTWPAEWLFKRTHEVSRIPPSSPDLLISSGPASMTALSYFSKRFRCPAVFVQGTVQVPENTFAAIMRPFEGECRDDYIFIPLLFTEITPELPRVAKAAPLKALFVGQSSAKIKFTPADWNHLIKFVNESWKLDAVQWLISTSYRTGLELENHLREHICEAAVYDAVWYGIEPRKITREYLSIADSVYVTMDSLTMLTEAVSSGLPVHAICPDDHLFDFSNSHHHYIAELEESKLLTLLRPGSPAADATWMGTPKPVDYEPAVRQLLSRIGWNP